MAADRSRIWFALFVLVIFVAGLASGILIGRQLTIRERAPLRAGAALPGPPAGRFGGPPRQQMLERLDRQLDLTPEQRQQIDAIFRARRDSLDRLQRDVRDRYQSEQEALRDEIRAVLSPEQREKFDRLVANAPRGPGRRGR
jgi:Spy/CpxP family protein refolding chaperone